VRWIHSSEVLEIASLLRGGELLLTGGQMLAQATPSAQRRYVRELAERRVTAVAIETDGALHAIPPAVLEEAAELDFPVVELRRRIPFVDVAEQINGELVNQSVTRLRYGGELAHAFSALLAVGADVAALLGLLVERSGAAAALYDGQGRLITEQRPDGDADDAEAALPATGDLTSRITVRGAHTATLVLSPGPDSDPELLTIISERACEALGLALLRSRPPSTRELAGSELARSACEPTADGDRLGQLGRVVGIDPDDPAVGIALATPTSTGLAGLDGLLRRYGRLAMDTSGTGGHVVLSFPDRRQAARMRNALVAELRTWAATLESVVVGVGPAVPRLAAVPTSMELAGSSIHRHPAFGPGRVADATTAAVVTLFDAPDLQGRREQFVAGQLAMLQALRPGERETLLHTLEAYFDSGCSKTRTAAVLHLQRQSLYGRLERAFELLGGDPTGTERALPLHLALRLRERPAPSGAQR
jgi:purine catabolism regulator